MKAFVKASGGCPSPERCCCSRVFRGRLPRGDAGQSRPRDVQVRIGRYGRVGARFDQHALVEGDELWVPEGSRAALQTTRGVYIRLDDGTALQILRMDLDSYQFHLTEGAYTC